MTTIGLAQAKAQLSDLVRRGQAGETIEITVRGRPAVKLVASLPAATKIDLAALDRLRSSIPYQEVSGADLVRQMRDEGY